MRKRLTIRRSRKRRGFTLMEVLLVLVILVILGSFSVSMLGNTRKAANERAAKSQVGLMKTAFDTYMLDMSTYPSSDQGISALLSEPSSSTSSVNKWRGPYLEKNATDPWGNPYQYKYPGEKNQNGYDLWSMGPDGQSGTDDDIGNWDATSST